jgi:3-oxoadipate enol-lactonase
VSLAYRDEGSGPPVVFASSLGSTHELWAPQAEALCDRMRVIRYDHLGHGGSPIEPLPDGIGSHGASVLGLLDELGVERACFVGLSMGGAVGQWLAVNAPGRIERLVLACTSSRFLQTADWPERARIVREQGVEAIADGIVARWFTPAFQERRPDVVAAARATLVATPPEGYARCCEALAGWSFLEQLPRVAAPTLVIAAAADTSTPPEHGALIAEAIPDAEMVVLPDAAHVACVEQAAAFTRLVAGHLLGGGTQDAA